MRKKIRLVLRAFRTKKCEKRSFLLALVVELKWDVGAKGAIRQIKDKNYGSLPAELGGEIILIGTDYNKKTKRHTCEIERIITR